MEILPCGAAVIEGDTHISKWVKQTGTLRIAERMLAPFHQYIPVGGVVVDAGAMIGDHTATYADWVGAEGSVYAFEPNPEAYECLAMNVRSLPQVKIFDFGLSNKLQSVKLNLSENSGASHLSDDEGSVLVKMLDSFALKRLDFMKIDVEGFETRVLRGAVQTILSCRPTMLIEVNSGALLRAGTSSSELCSVLSSLGYSTQITDRRFIWSDLQFDILCLPQEKQN